MYRGYQEILTLSVGLLLSGTAHALAIDELEQQILRDYPGAVIEEIETIKINGKPAYEVDYEFENSQFEAIYAADGQLLEITNEDFDSGSALIVGLYSQVESSEYRGGSTEVDVYPAVFYEKGSFYIWDRDIGYLFYQGAIDIAAQLSFAIGEGYEPDDNDFLADMEEPDMAVNAGLVIGKEFGNNWAIATVLQNDIAGAHKGFSAEFEVIKGFQLSRNWEVEIGAELTYNTDKVNDYYYGVAEKYARPDRPQYEAKGDVNMSLEMGFLYRFAERWYLLSELEFEYLGKEIRNSPIVDQDYITSLSVRVGYAFF